MTEAEISAALGGVKRKGPAYWYPNYVEPREIPTETKGIMRFRLYGEQVAELYLKNCTHDEICKALDLTAHQVDHILRMLREAGRVPAYRSKSRSAPKGERLKCANANVRKLCAAIFVDPEAIVSGSREHCHVLPRAAICWHLKMRRGVAYAEIGRRLYRDHSTVMHAASKVAANPSQYAHWLEIMEGVELEFLPLKPATVEP